MTSELSASHRATVPRLLSRFFNSIAYPILFAILCIISGVNDHTVYLPLICVLTALVVLSALVSTDHKVFLVPLMMAYYSLGKEVDGFSFSTEASVSYLQAFDPNTFPFVCLCGGIMASALLARLIADRTIGRIFKKRGICTVGILAMDVAFLLNGLFSNGYTPLNLLYGTLFGLTITLVYFVTLSMLDGSKDATAYACKTLVCTSYVALIQTIISAVQMYFSQESLFHYSYVLEQNLLRRQVLGWGLPTIIGAVMVLGIPAAMFLAKNRKCSFLSYISALLLLAGTLLVSARGAMMIGALFFLVCVLIGCFKGKNRRAMRIYTLSLCLLLIGVALYIHTKVISLPDLFSELFSLLRFNIIGEDSRLDLFRNGLEDFLRAPLMGVGIDDGAFAPDVLTNNVYSRMYHNTAIQFFASMGLVGVVAFFTHLKQMGEVAVRRFSADKLLILFVPLMLLALSMVDNFFFYPNFQIIYAVFLAIAEHMLEEARATRLKNHRAVKKEGYEEQKPRVAFTYVEAGKGHIIPEEAVARIFREKYGDKVETVESRFFVETGDPKLRKTEHLFIETVKNQNKNFVAGSLCRIGSFLCGDALSLQWTLTCTPSGINAYKRAKTHLLELDCDLLFTTHWSTAFYASKLKNPPYTVMLCPDPYSNGMFNVDVNQFLMPTEVGRKQAEGRRMYAGGNIRTLPLPLRPEAKEALGHRAELREKHGISVDSFTVILMDGGYGMANMEKTVRHLLSSGEKLTLLALCGTNDALKTRLDSLTPPENIDLRVIGFCDNVLEYVSLSDLFCGKAGANALAEAAYFGIPLMITKCATYIERHTKNYYKKTVKGALYIPSAKRAAKKIKKFARRPALLDPYREAIGTLRGISGEEQIADLLYEAIKNES